MNFVNCLGQQNETKYDQETEITPPLGKDGQSFGTDFSIYYFIFIIYWGGGTKMRKSLTKKLWPTPINGIKKIDPPKAQIKNCDPPLRQNSKFVQTWFNK